MKCITCSNIEVTYLTKNKQKIDALKGLNICFNSGIINSIVGENGCGKTTLFNCIIGLIGYDGEILINGINSHKLSIKDKKISYISQEIVLYPKLTIFDNIAYPLKELKLKSNEIHKRIYSILNEFGILHIMNCLPRQISLGQAQKVLLAKALISNPEIIILDEAFANVDQTNRVFIQNKLKEYATKNDCFVLNASHDIDNLISFTDCLQVIDNSSVLFSTNVKSEMSKSISEFLVDEKKKNQI